MNPEYERPRGINWPLIAVLLAGLAFWTWATVSIVRHFGPQGKTHIEIER